MDSGFRPCAGSMVHGAGAVVDKNRLKLHLSAGT